MEWPLSLVRHTTKSARKTKGGRIVPLTIEVEQEEDGRWLAEVPDLPGVLAYGQTRQEAIERAQILCLRVLADRLDHGEPVPQMSGVFAVTP
jgi:predicted RNase H-like HicB family nuclease